MRNFNNTLYIVKTAIIVCSVLVALLIMCPLNVCNNNDDCVDMSLKLYFNGQQTNQRNQTGKNIGASMALYPVTVGILTSLVFVLQILCYICSCASCVMWDCCASAFWFLVWLPNGFIMSYVCLVTWPKAMGSVAVPFTWVLATVVCFFTKGVLLAQTCCMVHKGEGYFGLDPQLSNRSGVSIFMGLSGSTTYNPPSSQGISSKTYNSRLLYQIIPEQEPLTASTWSKHETDDNSSFVLSSMIKNTSIQTKFSKRL